MKHDNDDQQDSPVVVPADSSNSEDAEDYAGLLELMVKFGKNDRKVVVINSGKAMSVMEFLWQQGYLQDLNAIRDRVVEQENTITRHGVSLWYLMTLLNSGDIETVVVPKFRQFICSTRAFDYSCNDEDKFSEIMELAAIELTKIKQQFPEQVGTMTSESELQSTIEMFLSFQRGLISLQFKIKMMVVYFWHEYPSRPEMHDSVNRMWETVEDELEQYVMELRDLGAKIKQVLKENIRMKAVKEKEEGAYVDGDEAASIEKRQLNVLGFKVKEWMSVVHEEYRSEDLEQEITGVKEI